MKIYASKKKVKKKYNISSQRRRRIIIQQDKTQECSDGWGQKETELATLTTAEPQLQSTGRPGMLTTTGRKMEGGGGWRVSNLGPTTCNGAAAGKASDQLLLTPLLARGPKDKPMIPMIRTTAAQTKGYFFARLEAIFRTTGGYSSVLFSSLCPANGYFPLAGKTVKQEQIMLIDLRRLFYCSELSSGLDPLRFKDPTPKKVLTLRQDLSDIGPDFAYKTFFGVGSLDIRGSNSEEGLDTLPRHV